MALKKKSKQPARASAAGSAVKNDARNSLGIRPLGDRILIKPLTPAELGEKNLFGIIIPDTVSKEKSDRGVVMAAGAGKKNERGDRVALEVKVGDRVLYTRPWNDPVKIDGAEYYLIAESDILAIIK